MDCIEWNYRLLAQQEPEDYQEFIANFDRLFAQARPMDEEWLKEYTLSRSRPRRLGRGPAAREEVDRPYPRGAQIEALHYLERSRAEGFRRGMVVMATGVGKTYLAAFASRFS